MLFIKKPVASAADLADVKMRVPEIRTYLLLWQTLGTKPARVAWGEVFLGLKTGVIDAAEGPVLSAFAAKFHQAAPVVVRTDHVIAAHQISMNDKAFQALPVDQQKLLVDAAQEAMAWVRKQSEEEINEVYKKMEAEGAKVIVGRQGYLRAEGPLRRRDHGEGRRLVARPLRQDPGGEVGVAARASRRSGAAAFPIRRV